MLRLCVFLKSSLVFGISERLVVKILLAQKSTKFKKLSANHELCFLQFQFQFSSVSVSYFKIPLHTPLTKATYTNTRYKGN